MVAEQWRHCTERRRGRTDVPRTREGGRDRRARYFFFSVCSVCLRRRGQYLLELQLLAARLAAERVVVVAGLVADEKHGFDLLLAFGHPLGLPESAPADFLRDSAKNLSLPRFGVS